MKLHFEDNLEYQKAAIEAVADLFRGLSLLDPIRHFVEIVRAVFLKGEGYAGLWRQFAALVLLAIGFLALAVLRLRASTD